MTAGAGGQAYRGWGRAKKGGWQQKELLPGRCTVTRAARDHSSEPASFQASSSVPSSFCTDTPGSLRRPFESPRWPGAPRPDPRSRVVENGAPSGETAALSLEYPQGRRGREKREPEQHPPPRSREQRPLCSSSVPLPGDQSPVGVVSWRGGDRSPQVTRLRLELGRGRHPTVVS